MAIKTKKSSDNIANVVDPVELTNLVKRPLLEQDFLLLGEISFRLKQGFVFYLSGITLSQKI